MGSLFFFLNISVTTYQIKIREMQKKKVSSPGNRAQGFESRRDVLQEQHNLSITTYADSNENNTRIYF